MTGKVVSVSSRGGHGLGKTRRMSVRLIEGMGVEGDAHYGAKVQHRSRKRQNPELVNLRQVHLIHAELLAELDSGGFNISPGDLGENILTQGVDLLALPNGTILSFADGARIAVTGLRNPCVQLERHSKGLMNAVLDRDPSGGLVRKCGVMAVVIESGEVCVGDPIKIIPPAGAYVALQPI